MEHESGPDKPESEEQEEWHHPDHQPAGCGSIVLKFVGGAVVLLIVAIALVFGVCFLGSG